MQIVKIENTGDVTLIVPHNGDKYVIKAGDAKIVPYDAAASLFGDPRARDDERVKGRRDIYNHIRGLWNYHLGFDNEETWQTKMPKFVATDVNSGERIYFVVQDPDGSETFKDTNGVSDDTTDNRLLGATLAALQAQVESLQRQMAAQNDDRKVAQAPEVVPAPPDPIETTSSPAPAISAELPRAAPGDPKVRRDGPRTVPTGG